MPVLCMSKPNMADPSPHLPFWVSMAGPGNTADPSVPTADPSVPTHQYILGGRCDVPAINPRGSRSLEGGLALVTGTATVQWPPLCRRSNARTHSHGAADTRSFWWQKTSN